MIFCVVINLYIIDAITIIWYIWYIWYFAVCDDIFVAAAVGGDLVITAADVFVCFDIFIFFNGPCCIIHVYHIVNNMEYC